MTPVYTLTRGGRSSINYLYCYPDTLQWVNRQIRKNSHKDNCFYYRIQRKFRKITLAFLISPWGIFHNAKFNIFSYTWQTDSFPKLRGKPKIKWHWFHYYLFYEITAITLYGLQELFLIWWLNHFVATFCAISKHIFQMKLNI